MFGFETEKYELSIFKQMIKHGDVVVDLGANMGLYTLVSAKLVGDSGKVYSFEPDSITFTTLTKNVIENSHKNVVLINKAVSAKTGVGRFSVDSDESISVANRLITNESEKHVTIETVSLDDFFKNIDSKPNIIKMDVEGAEFDVLKGMENLIKNNESMKIFLEFYPATLTRSSVNIPEFVDYIYSFGFSIYNIDEKNQSTKLVDKDWILTYVKSHMFLQDGYTNLLCTRDKNFEKY